MSATPESPIAVFRTRQEPGKSSLVKCMFANTVKTQELIASGNEYLIGVFDGSYDRLDVMARIREGL